MNFGVRMNHRSIREAILDLLWSAWAELGVPGVERRHRRLASDPDPLIVFTPALATEDPRLVEQTAAWCERHGDFVSKTRLDGLKRRAPREVSSAFDGFAGSLGDAAADWGQVKGLRPRTRAVGATTPPLERPALARLRMRTLAGTGARADVLCELLGSLNTWTTATDLERLGYARRSVARVLADLTAARLTSERSGKGAASFRLRDPHSLAGLVEAEALSWPDWTALLTLAWHLVQLEGSGQPSPAVASVKARDAWDDLRGLSAATGLREPPVPASDPSAWPSLLDWGAKVLRQWPGDSPATR
jgi:hypothetical protein